MKVIDTLSEKPWLAEINTVAYSQKSNVIPERIALRFFLGAVSILFFLFIVTFLSRSQFPDFQALSGQPWQPFTDVSQLWLNSFLLLMASIALQWGVIASQRKQLNSSIMAIFLGFLLSIAFIVAQLFVWEHLMSLGYYVGSNPANSFYYMLTAIHGLHLIGGLFVLAKVIVIFWTTQSLERLNKSLSLCATYWHYLFVVWLLLFALLTSSSDTYKTIAALCGF